MKTATKKTRANDNATEPETSDVPLSRYDGDDFARWGREALEELFFGARLIASHTHPLDPESAQTLAELTTHFANVLEAFRAYEDTNAHLEKKVARLEAKLAKAAG